MTNENAVPQRIDEYIQSELQAKDPDAQIQVKRTSLGWLKLSVTTKLFEKLSLSEREAFIDTMLTTLNLSLGQYPFADYVLLTPDENSTPLHQSAVQLPLWSEILMAPEPDISLQIDEDLTKRPFVVTFYSFKGGVGRTTALGLVAGMLVGRERRVVMIDFDLEAPGLSLMFPPIMNGQPTCGVVDYIYQRNLTPDLNQPDITTCIQQIDIPARGELYLIPAGAYDERYIHRLADLDVRLLYQRDHNPFHQMLDEITSSLDPDVILIDARTGFNDMGAVALLDQADLGVVCFSPTDQSFAGLRWVVQAANKQRRYRGIPDLRFLLTPLPPVDTSQLQMWITRTADWIGMYWDVPEGLTIADLYSQIPYNPSLTTLESLVTDVPPGILEPYVPIADTITASLPERGLDIPLAQNRSTLLHELTFRSATAQEIDLNEIPNIFQRTGDFPKFLHDRTWLVRGAKGTGKSLLFRLFIERNETAVSLAKPDADLRHVTFIPGHGPERTQKALLNSTDLASFEQQAGEDRWTLFWMNYALLQLCTALPEIHAQIPLDPQLIELSRQSTPSHADRISWLVSRVQSPQAAPQANDELRSIDQWLSAQKKRIWLLYDELDIGFGQDKGRRRRALEALFGWWIEISSALNSMTPKILLREDIWTELNFTNKAHFSGRFVQLRWEEDDLWRLVLRQTLSSSRTMSMMLNDEYGVTIDRLDSIETAQLRKSLHPLWGERMGRGKKAYTHNWIRNRITDSQNNRFPRSLIVLLQRAVEFERSYGDRNPYETILTPRALIDSLPFASEQRVEEVRNEYPELDPYLLKLQNERSAISLDRLEEIWNVHDAELNAIVSALVKAGIIQEYSRQPKTDQPRYAVAELYLYGLGMIRSGQR